MAPTTRQAELQAQQDEQAVTAEAHRPEEGPSSSDSDHGSRSQGMQAQPGLQNVALPHEQRLEACAAVDLQDELQAKLELGYAHEPSEARAEMDQQKSLPIEENGDDKAYLSRRLTHQELHYLKADFYSDFKVKTVKQKWKDYKIWFLGMLHGLEYPLASILEGKPYLDEEMPVGARLNQLQKQAWTYLNHAIVTYGDVALDDHMDPFRNSPIPHKQVSEAWRHIDSFKGEEFSVTSRDLDAQFNDFQRNPNESVIGACMRLQTIIQKERLFNRHRDIESIAWKMFDKALPDSSLQWGMLKTTL
eukprot:11666699-Ditylum_brightwellii.AAC.1